MMQEKPKCKSYFNVRKKLWYNIKKQPWLKKNDEDTWEGEIT
jgi:hypothetical protein